MLASACGISTVGNCDLKWERLICPCLRGKSGSSVSTGSFSFSPVRVLLFTWVPAVPGSNSQLDAWFCAEFSANSLSLLLLQCYLYLFYSSARKVKTFVLLFCVCSCNIYLYGLRNLWQISFHIGVASLSSYQILARQLLEKQPDCGVWKKNLGFATLIFTTLFFFAFTWPKIAQNVL